MNYRDRIRINMEKPLQRCGNVLPESNYFRRTYDLEVIGSSTTYRVARALDVISDSGKGPSFLSCFKIPGRPTHGGDHIGYDEYCNDLVAILGSDEEFLCFVKKFSELAKLDLRANGLAYLEQIGEMK